MTPERWQQISELFHHALTLDNARRVDFLIEACGDDKALRSEVESLLAQADCKKTEISTLVGAATRDVSDEKPLLARIPPVPLSHSVIGSYRILSKLGEGGMGIVYEAEQANPQRRVALKVIRGGAYVDENHVKLFERETQALARLKHPGVAAIFEAGRTPDGQHFFAMELVAGVTLDIYARHELRQRPLAMTLERFVLSLFLKISDAIAYAHQRGVIHRDLKPSNIVVSTERERTEGIPDVKILDFGLARVTEADLPLATVMSEPGRIQGTLRYMSPEQARGDPDNIDARTDVYALGVILYELITSQPPYKLDGLPLVSALAVIGNTPPGRMQDQDKDLRAILSKALEKDADARYQTVSAFRDDVARYLNGHPVLAQPQTALYQLAKFAKRHKVGAAISSAAVLSLAIVAAAMTLQANRLARERDRASTEAATAQSVSDFLTGLFTVSDPSESRGNRVTAREILDVGARQVETNLQEQPLVRARLMLVMGRVYQSLGLFDPGAKLSQDALAIRRATLGNLNAETAEAQRLLGVGLWRKGDFSGAEKEFREVLESRRALLGYQHPAVAESLDDLGTLRSEQGDYARAEELFREAVAMLRELRPPRIDLLSDVLSNLGMAVEEGKADYPSAIRLLKESLDLSRSAYSGDHPLLAQKINNLGMAHYRAKQYGEAESLLQEALAMNRRLLGDSHPEIASNLNNIGLLLRDKPETDVSGAERYFVQALDMSRSSQGAEHPGTLGILNNLAALHLQKRNYRQAESMFREELAIQKTALPETDFQVATTKSLLGATLTGTKQYKEAETLLVAAYAVISQRFGVPHPRTQATLRRIVRLYEVWGKPAQANEYKKLLNS